MTLLCSHIPTTFRGGLATGSAITAKILIDAGLPTSVILEVLEELKEAAKDVLEQFDEQVAAAQAKVVS